MEMNENNMLFKQDKCSSKLEKCSNVLAQMAFAIRIIV